MFKPNTGVVVTDGCYRGWVGYVVGPDAEQPETMSIVLLMNHEGESSTAFIDNDYLLDGLLFDQ